MLLAACTIWELATLMSGDLAYRAGVAVVVIAGFLLVWLNLAVGIIGTERDPANLMFVAVLAIVAIGAMLGRFRPAGLALASLAAALAQLLVGLIAVAAHLGFDGPRWPVEIPALTAFFAGLWLVSAWLFRKAALGQGASRPSLQR